MAVKNDHVREIYILAILTSILIGVFAAITIFQINWTKDLQEKHANTRREIERLQTKCLENIIKSIYLDEIQGARIDDRRRRQAGSLQQMIQEMMAAQEKILLSHCLNSTGLCVKGQKGMQGIVGDPGLPATQGLQGTVGVTGPKGDTGLTGPSGIKGFKGANGVQGPVGVAGSAGIRGTKGFKGAAGQTGAVGKQGPRGLKGEKGDTGDVGPVGPTGQLGATGILQGPNGEKGSMGMNGTAGIVGPIGAQGVDLQKDCQCVKKSDIDTFTHPPAYYIGQNVSLVCDSSSNPKPIVVWYGLNGPCGQKVVHSPTFNIYSLQPSQTGTYTCVANSILGIRNKTVNIQLPDTNYLDCDFENGTLCNWFNSQTDAYSWLILNGSTPHSNTGPSVDHTLGTLGGHYLYTRGRTHSKDRATDLISPQLGAEDGCLTFWYHMHGHVGKLEVVTERTQCNGTKSLINSATISKNSDQWHFASVNILGGQLDHRLLIKSIQSGSIDDDIAIDDIHYFSGKCKPTLIRTRPAVENVTVTAGSPLRLHCGIEGYPNVTYQWRKLDGCGKLFNGTGETISFIDNASSGYSGTYECTASSASQPPLSQIFNVNVNGTSESICDFQHGFCGWSQLKSDIFDWSLNQGATTSQETGPMYDHTLGNMAGKYAFIEASSPQRIGDYAVLKSPLLKGNQSVCFSFYYYMYGVDTGNLIIKAEDACTQRETVLFSTSGDKGEKWLHASVTVPKSTAPRDYHITIKATVGQAFHSDTSIDDLRITEGNCSYLAVNFLDCTFDKDLCGWTQSKTDDFDWSNDFGETPSTGTGPEHDHTNPNGMHCSKNTKKVYYNSLYGNTLKLDIGAIDIYLESCILRCKDTHIKAQGNQSLGRGHYLYTEASSKAPNDHADLISPEILPGAAICLKLFTNMHGPKMGNITILKEDVGSSTMVPITSFHNTDSVSIWRPHSVTIPASANNFHIVIRGIIGTSYTSDAAIDDITATNGRC